MALLVDRNGEWPPGPHKHDVLPGEYGLLASEVDGTQAGFRSIDPDRDSVSIGGSLSLPDDDHGAQCVAGSVLAYRPEEDLADPAVPAAAEH